MAKTPTFSVVGEDAQDTAPSEKSVETTPPEKGTEEEEERIFLMDEMDKLPDLDLVKIALAATVILHQRGEAAEIKSGQSG